MSINAWRRKAEERISQAIDEGKFNDLPGMGKPLELEDDSRVPEELRLAYKVLKNAGYTPPELEARKELRQVEDMLKNAPDEKARYQALKRMNYLSMKLATLRPDSALFEDNRYSDRVVDVLGKKKGQAKDRKE
jgi:hypothetical protein